VREREREKRKCIEKKKKYKICEAVPRGSLCSDLFVIRKRKSNVEKKKVEESGKEN